jgi:hypothetical protein
MKTGRVERMDTPPLGVSTTRLGGPGRGPGIVVLLAVAFVSVSVLIAAVTGRPAPVAAAATSAAGPAGAAQAPDGSPSPTPGPTLRPGEMPCMPAGWRLAYIGSMGAWSVETWLVVAPGLASGPLDPGIPVAHLGHDVVRGLGACAPPVGTNGAGRPAVIERAWRLSPAGRPRVATELLIVALDGSTPRAAVPPDALELVRPADGASGGWTAGDYVLDLLVPASTDDGPGAARTAWVRIELDGSTP